MAQAVDDDGRSERDVKKHVAAARAKVAAAEDEWWKENYYRPRGNPGSFREAPDIPKKPLIAIYFLVNEWYRRVLGAKFWPDYSSGMEAASDDIGRLPHIGPAARLFFLVANEIDKKYTMDRCKKVHEDYYRKLPKKFLQR